MDRSLYVAMSGAKETLLAQTSNNHNLANAGTNGFKADLSAFQSRAVQGPGYASRVYSTDATVGFDNTTGALAATGQELDVAVQGDGWIAVQGRNGQEAYTRAGDLHVDVNGLLLTATGHPVLNDSGPISIPPYTTIHVGRDGTISIVPVGQQASTMAAIARIKLVNPPASALLRGEDGLFHTTNGTPADGDASVSLASGVLESSNVNVADAMVQMIELARRFDLQIKAMKNTDENAQVTAKLLGLS